MQLYRDGGLNARIAFNAMSGYDINRVIPETQNTFGFLGDDMFKYLGPGEDVMATDPLYADVMRWSASKRLSVETHVGNIDAILNGFEAADTVYDVGKLKWRIAHPGNGRAERHADRAGEGARHRLGADVLPGPERGHRPALPDGDGEQRARCAWPRTR